MKLTTIVAFALLPTLMELLPLSTMANAEQLDRKDLFVKDGDTIIVRAYDKHEKGPGISARRVRHSRDRTWEVPG